jgi:hypothetical protein
MLAMSSRKMMPSRMITITQEASAPGIVPMNVLSNCASSGGGILKSPSTALCQKP